MHRTETITAWNKSRSGAWAGRGFHYQHLFSTLILIRQWAGLAPSGNLVPEGMEDCVVEFPTQEFWLQIKSRKKGTFSKTEVQQILVGMNAKATAIRDKTKRNISVVFEQPSSGLKSFNIDRLFEGISEQVLVCSSPKEECVAILKKQLDTAEIIAEGIVSDLYNLVASASEENTNLSFEERRRISITEVEHRIYERLEAEDPSAIDRVLVSGVLEPIDLNSSVSEPTFYRGVKVTLGHVTAGLVFDRPIDRENVIRVLRPRRHVLVSGQSGAGKSALVWLSVSDLAGELRWFQITSRAVAADASPIIQFIRARRPTEVSPIGLVFDEVGSINASLWNVLVRELRGIPSVYFLGSVRQEDVALISNHADTEFIEVILNQKLAEGVWQKLRTLDQTNWEHWREPFEQSEGLMLEYVHILTQGKRLAAVIEDQIMQRQQEGRHDGLAIIRSTAILSTYGGDIRAGKLFDLLGMNSHIASEALARLIDEHLVRETKPGVIGGLHILRSRALRRASHDETIYLSSDSLWRSLLAVTNETLPRVIQSIIVDTLDLGEVITLRKVAEILSDTQDIDTWVSILTGLGLATLENNVFSFIEILKQHNVQRAQWWLASLFSDPQIDIPKLTEFEQWHRLEKAILAFRALPKHDLRHACLAQLPEERSILSCQNLQQANKLLSCLAPICGGEPVHITISPTFVGDRKQDIREVAALLSTAFLISHTMARQLVDELGGEQVLFDWFQSQTPWVTAPTIDSKGEHGRTIRSNMFYVIEKEQFDPHESVCNICETLIAISPESDAAASDAVTPSGLPIAVGDFRPWSKNMPRRNIAAKTRVAWNVAFRQILLARSAEDSLTDYTLQMAELVKRTERVFRSFSEKWIKGGSIANADVLAKEINDIIETVNALAYAAPEKPANEMTIPAAGAGQNDSLGALLTGILGNLLRRMNKIPSEEKPKGAAMFSADLAVQARDYEKSEIWRTSVNPPLGELSALSKRLTEVSYILHELAYDDSSSSVQEIISSSKKSSLNKAIATVAKICHLHADQRFNKKLRALENALKGKGWDGRCWYRSLDEIDSVYWPAMEVAIAVHIQDFVTEATYLDDALSLGHKYLGSDWRFRVVPVINGFVVASLALLPSSQLTLPDQDFARDWQKHIDLPFLSSTILEKFDKACGACFQLSAIMACRNLKQLHPEEDKAISHAIETFEENRDFISEAVENSALLI